MSGSRHEHAEPRLGRVHPARARAEILKHLDGPLQIRPLPAPAGQRSAEIIGRVKPNSLLAADQEAAGCLRMVAGARNAECYTVPEVYWIDLR